jgi:hypothetical protein
MLDSITIRRMPFTFEEEIDPVVVRGDLEQSFAIVAGSLLLPHLEPYLIRSMKAAESAIEDPNLLQDLKRFAAQEGQHYRMHMKWNATIRRAGFPGLAELEAELARDFDQFSRNKSLRFNLAYAEGFEAFTTNAVKLLMEPDGFGEDLSPFMQMLEWHFVEELEHRHVAFDVYEHVCGGYFYRLFVGIYAQWHFTRWIRRTAKYMLKAHAKRAQKGAPGDVVDGTTFTMPRVRDVLPSLFRIYLPSYTPHRVEVSEGMERLAERYTAMALRQS